MKKNQYISKLIIIALLITYKLILDYAYYFIVQPLNSYMGFGLTMSWSKEFESIYLLILIGLIMPPHFDRPSKVIINLLLIVSFVPMLVTYTMMDQPRIYMYCYALFFIILASSCHWSDLYFKPLKPSQQKLIFRLLNALVFIIVIASMASVYISMGSINLDIYKVYEIRTQYNSLELGGVKYLINWTAYILNPLLFGVLWIKKRWIIMTLPILLQVVLFSLTGSKIYLFLIPCVFGVLLLVKKRTAVHFIIGSFIVVSIAGILFPQWSVSDIFLRRSLLLPALISFNYYEYFSALPPLFLSGHHLIDFFIAYPYDVLPPHMIGRAFLLHNVATNANSGVIADGYINFGTLGIVFWGLITGMVLKLYDSLTRNKDQRLACAATCGIVILLTESALLTAFITGGILFSFFLLYLLPPLGNPSEISLQKVEK